MSAKIPQRDYISWSFTNVLCFLLISSFFPSILPALTAVGKATYGAPLRQSKFKNNSTNTCTLFTTEYSVAFTFSLILFLNGSLRKIKYILRYYSQKCKSQ